MTWAYFIINCTVLTAAGFLGWRSRRLKARQFGVYATIGAILMCIRTFLHAHPEYEQYLLMLSDHYIYFVTWEIPLAVLMIFGLAVRMQNRRTQRLVFLSLGLLVPLFLWDSLAVCLQPDYAMKAQFDDNGICRQSTDYSCGPAAAVMLLKHTGEEISEGEMATLCLLRPNKGVTTLELCHGINVALKHKYLRAAIERVRPEQLDSLPTPFLAEIMPPGSRGHCVAVLQVQKDALLLGDPARGQIVCAREVFVNEWSGIAITVRQSAVFAMTYGD